MDRWMVKQWLKDGWIHFKVQETLTQCGVSGGRFIVDCKTTKYCCCIKVGAQQLSS